MRMRTAVLCLSAAIAAVSVVACGEEPPPAVKECEEGLVWGEDGSCQVPSPNCDPGAPGSIAAECAARNRTCFEDGLGEPLCGTCIPGFVEEQGNCRPVLSCEALDCEEQGRTCVETDGLRDAFCGECLRGEMGVEGRCVRRTCDPFAEEGSIAAECAAASRHCIEGEEEASCGGCYPGFVESRGVCRAVRTCAELRCAEGERSCTPAQANADAECGACRAGFVESGGLCRRMLGMTCDDGAENSLLAACTAENRHCEMGDDGAECGGCMDGFVLDPESNRCVPFVGCGEVDCASEHRACAEIPLATCTECLDGFVEDPATGKCRPVRTCDEIRCGAQEQCREATAQSDAFCHPACGPNESWAGNRCTTCPPCDGEGEDGVYPELTTAGSCICQTRPGYFYSTAGDVGTFPCDADGDGWVRESARRAIESTDPALVANARCDLRWIDRVLLINEAGQQKEIALQEPLALYETDRNDDQAILSVQWKSKGLRGHRADGSLVSARELNRFTKLCHDPRTDYNDNGVPDVSEWSGHVPGPAMRPEQAPFNEFSYFVELATGHYEPPTAGGTHGRWVIRERQRAETAEAESRLPIGYGPSDGDYWRQCELWPDPRFGKVEAPVGMDFARYSDWRSPVFTGMNLHSQFKCLVLRDEPRDGAVEEMTPGEAISKGFVFNRCTSRDGSGTEPEVDCALVDASALQPGEVLWGAVPYQDYGPTPFAHVGDGDPTEGYAGGCINACTRALFEHPECADFYAINPLAISCDRDVNDFGKFLGCDKWEVCDGQDNTGEGLVDEGNPGGGLYCDVPGQTGICLAGTTNCRDGEIVCDQNLPPTEPMCNGLDNDCDGEIDTTFADDGGPCTLPDELGRCAEGRKICTLLEDEEGGIVGGRIDCLKQYEPEDERCGDSIDWDCDGDPTTQAGSKENLQGCVNYYRDKDGDGYPDRNYPPRCLCGPDSSSYYTYKEPADPFSIEWDCCDESDLTYPGSPALEWSQYTGLYHWPTEPNACNSFDYNCDGKEEKRYTYVARSCEKKGNVFTCHLPNGSGWDSGPAPECGETRPWAYNCKYNAGTTGCKRETYVRVQECR